MRGERKRKKTNNANISLQVLTYIFIPSTHSSVKVHVFNAVAAACVAKPPQVSSKREYRSSRSWLYNHHHPCVAAALEPDLKSRLTHQTRSKSRLVLMNPLQTTLLNQFKSQSSPKFRKMSGDIVTATVDFFSCLDFESNRNP